ncbi:MAG: thioredoxin domain-containing protein, partial [Bacteroidota bacterium]
AALLTEVAIDTMAVALQGAVDYRLGGLRGAPKFPLPTVYEFLLAHHFHAGDAKSLSAVETTLDAMASGGIYDQLGGGFSRYSTDERWLVPHFEKMLYDNAQLISLYAHAYQATGKKRYAEVVEQSLGFLAAELKEGEAFISSLDADTEGEEGLTYVWTAAEIEKVLHDAQLAQAFNACYGVTAAGNWEGHNILHLTTADVQMAARHGYSSIAELDEALAGAKKKLLAVRNERPQPARDDKILMAWNALTVTAYADAYRALGDAAYRRQAEETARFLWSEMRHESGSLYRSYKDGTAAINAFLDDYALLAQACIDVYEITFAEIWLERAQLLVGYVDQHFYAEDKGLYRYTSDQDPPLISGTLPVEDKAIPSGNSLMARVLHQLGVLTADDEMVVRSQVAGAIQTEARRWV